VNKEYVYLDYNATSPLAQNVKSFLAKGDLLFANPSSVHSLGKLSRKYINSTVNYIEELFGLKNHRVVFNSGATESVNTIVKSLMDEHSKKFTYIYFVSDHSCVRSQADYITKSGGGCVELKTGDDGLINLEELYKKTLEISKDKQTILVNLTWVNSETGVIQDISRISAKLSQLKNVLIHVDAVQSIGKIENYTELTNDAHFYTYSAHKFGGLKGIGFSLIKNTMRVSPLILGGGQQANLRSGTENTLGVYCVKLALEAIHNKLDFKKNLDNRNKLELKLEQIMREDGFVVGKSSKRAVNTISIVLKNHKADETLIYFDVNKIAISAGSACSSSSLTKSATIMSMSGEEYSDKAIRISLPIIYSDSDYVNIVEPLCKVMSSFLR
jgi:cysteine desulfurase